jgi:hypothetical protein
LWKESTVPFETVKRNARFRHISPLEERAPAHDGSEREQDGAGSLLQFWRISALDEKGAWHRRYLAEALT